MQSKKLLAKSNIFGEFMKNLEKSQIVFVVKMIKDMSFLNKSSPRIEVKKQSDKILVTKSFLPPKEDYTRFLAKIWESHHLTNSGPNVLELEKQVAAFCECQNTFFVSNGTIALQLAIRALGLSGEIITTPFSYVATTSSIVWERCTPIFVDINSKYLTIDCEKIVDAITPRTVAILATHVYGFPCDIEKIDLIAKNYNLKVIYDAAHTFGSRYKGKTLTSFGDISTLSFHATKIFHTVEGGAVVCRDEAIGEKVSYMRNFGHDGPEAFQGIGINGKNSEFHAAMGLCIFPHFEKILAERQKICFTYDEIFARQNLIKRPKILAETVHNGAYYPIIFQSEEQLKLVLNLLNDVNVFPRRYFYPSLSLLKYLDKKMMPIAEDVAPRIACLPVYPGLPLVTVSEIAHYICEIVGA